MQPDNNSIFNHPLYFARRYLERQQNGASDNELLNIYNQSGESGCGFEHYLRVADREKSCKEQHILWKNKIKEKLRFEKEDDLYL